MKFTYNKGYRGISKTGVKFLIADQVVDNIDFFRDRQFRAKRDTQTNFGYKNKTCSVKIVNYTPGLFIDLVIIH